MILLAGAVGATVLALFAGLRNFWCAGTSVQSHYWMRIRLICQGVALALFALMFSGGV